MSKIEEIENTEKVAFSSYIASAFSKFIDKSIMESEYIKKLQLNNISKEKYDEVVSKLNEAISKLKDSEEDNKKKSDKILNLEHYNEKLIDKMSEMQRMNVYEFNEIDCKSEKEILCNKKKIGELEKKNKEIENFRITEREKMINSFESVYKFQKKSFDKIKSKLLIFVTKEINDSVFPPSIKMVNIMCKYGCLIPEKYRLNSHVLFKNKGEYFNTLDSVKNLCETVIKKEKEVDDSEEEQKVENNWKKQNEEHEKKMKEDKEIAEIKKENDIHMAKLEEEEKKNKVIDSDNVTPIKPIKSIKPKKKTPKKIIKKEKPIVPITPVLKKKTPKKIAKKEKPITPVLNARIKFIKSPKIIPEKKIEEKIIPKIIPKEEEFEPDQCSREDFDEDKSENEEHTPRIGGENDELVDSDEGEESFDEEEEEYPNE